MSTQTCIADAGARSTKILLIGNYEPEDQKSMKAFWVNQKRLLEELGYEVRVALPRPILLSKIGGISPFVDKWVGYVDKFLLFPAALKSTSDWADVVHICDHSNSMYAHRLRRPTLITCHDVIAIRAAKGLIPDWSVGFAGQIFQRLITRALSLCDRIICDSRLTCRELLELKIVSSDKVDVIDLSLNGDFRPILRHDAQAAIERFGLADGERYLLHVGSAHQRKNRGMALRAFAEILRRSNPANIDRMVFVGPDFDGEWETFIREQKLQQKLLILSDVSHDELNALYSASAGLVFPSLQEGFGWPVIEAQACGCPVFSSDLAPMNDIAGAAAVYFDPRDATSIADAILQGLENSERLRALGLANAERFSASRMIAAYVKEYEALASASGSAATRGSA